MYGPKEKQDDREFDNSGEAFEADLDDIYRPKEDEKDDDKK